MGAAADVAPAPNAHPGADLDSAPDAHPAADLDPAPDAVADPRPTTRRPPAADQLGAVTGARSV